MITKTCPVIFILLENLDDIDFVMLMPKAKLNIALKYAEHDFVRYHLQRLLTTDGRMGYKSG